MQLNSISIFPPATISTRARLAIVHGYGDHAGRYRETMSWFSERGVASHAIDLRGHGKSPGRRAYVHRWDEYLDDLQQFLGSIQGTEPLFLLGHSHGGLILAVAGIRGLLSPFNVHGCILTAPYFVNALPIPGYKLIGAYVANIVCPWLQIRSGVKSDFTTRDPQKAEESRNDPLLLRFATPRWFLGHRVAQAEALANAKRFTYPLLVAHGDADPIADIRGAKQFHAAAGSTDKSFVVYPEYRHEPLRDVGRERVYADILQWIDQRVPVNA